MKGYLMSLIECPGCNHEISTKATQCPNCGYPIDEEMQFLGEYNPINILHDLIYFGNNYIREKISENPYAPQEILKELINTSLRYDNETEKVSLLTKIAENPNHSEESLQFLMNSIKKGF